MAERLRARGAEIEEAILARVYSVSDPTTVEDAGYTHGLREAVNAAVAHGLEAIEVGEERTGSVPLPILSQARTAARNAVGLEVVLRRYTAGYAVLCDFLMQEMRSVSTLVGPSNGPQRNLTAVFDDLVSVVSAEYQKEAEHLPITPAKEKRAERVRRLLRGELIDTRGLDYDLGAWHVAVVAAGIEVTGLLSDLGRKVDRRLLLVELDDCTAWAWFGGAREFADGELAELMESNWPTEISVGFGEPATGMQGWRRSHRQAEAALTVALRAPTAAASYQHAALLAAALRDDDLQTFMADRYLGPLSEGGSAVCETVSAYLRCQLNVSSTAALLRINRRTVTNRIRGAERRLGRPLGSCLAELDLALRLLSLNGNDPTAGNSQEGHSTLA